MRAKWEWSRGTVLWAGDAAGRTLRQEYLIVRNGEATECRTQDGEALGGNGGGGRRGGGRSGAGTLTSSLNEM